MKKATLAAIALAITTTLNAQCFVLREAIQNTVVQAIPDPSNWAALFGASGSIYPINTRLFKWNSPEPVTGEITFYGMLRDNPATPQNEGSQMVYFPSVAISGSYYGTYTFRFSECNIQQLTDYNTTNLREFVAQLILKNAVTGKYVNAAYFRWSR